MIIRPKKIQKMEFGDFQTPPMLAQQVCALLRSQGVQAKTLIEPTCGSGNFLLAALDEFGEAEKAVGFDINADYVTEVREKLSNSAHAQKTDVSQTNFFDTDWLSLLQRLPGPLLVIGNPPWVTNAALGSVGSSNLPDKSNFRNHRGIEAITGKGNFDISEWMMLRMVEWLKDREAVLAMLCKSAVARKVLSHTWERDFGPSRSDLYSIPAMEHFGVSVDACLLVCAFGGAVAYEASSYGTLAGVKPESRFGYRENRLVANVDLYERWKHLGGVSPYKWRSGIKHDCAQVLELEKIGSCYLNGLGESLELEDTYLYPMLKSSDLANGKAQKSRWMLVPQTIVGGNTGVIESSAPKTWRYLSNHRELLDRRGSSIYKGRPPFSIFGIGPYSFAPWKVAISGFYKRLNFQQVGPLQGRPVVFDDTCYFLACSSEEESRRVVELLNSNVARDFYRAFVFWDAKRPITAELLQRLSLPGLARALNTEPLALVLSEYT